MAVAGVLAVVVGVATAFVVGRDNPAQPAAVASPATTSVTPATGNKTTPDKGTDPAPPPTPRPPVDQPDRAAKAAAVAFMRELGMRDPVAASYRRTGAATAEVGLHPRAGEGGRLLDTITTKVQLHRYTNGWVATGARADTIEVEQPLPFSRISSPLPVSGMSVAYEGTVHVTVTEDRRGADRVLGKGFVTGGADSLGPFSGQVTFTRPTGDAGWVVFTPDSGADLGVFTATAVRVRFVNSDHKPQILGVVTDPRPAASSQLVTLAGTGTLTVGVKGFAIDELRVLLVPSGTGNRPHAKLLGVDRTSENGERWSVSWRYPDQSFHGHLLIQANGRGGTAEHDGIAVYHA
ncbi:MAG: Gmad2 immunoglobulin-like domain-containing protein [Actinomycetota bacterium]